MLFNSYTFIFLFMPVVIVGTRYANRFGRDVAVAFLGVASLVFYGYWNPTYLPLIVGSVLVNHRLGHAIGAAPHPGSRRRWLVAGVALNLGLLGYFKYAAFIVTNLNHVFDTTLAPPKVALPLAISFFTFQQIAFLVDTSRAEARPGGLLPYGFFVTFFPQLIAGPIVSHHELLPQLARKWALKIRSRNFAVGMSVFVLGLFKKVVIADSLAPFANTVFDAADRGVGAPTLFEAWGGALAYTFQLYFDFSGYSDMAIGLGLVFGLRLPFNFDSPYKATSVIEFWRRWHITLSRFLRDYLYIALGGNRRGKARRHLNLMVTMLLGGLWHGAGWNFMFWGGLHGTYLIVNHGLRSLLPPTQSWAAARVGQVMTFGCVVLGWIFFRATTTDGAMALLRGMAGMEGVYLPASIADRFFSGAEGEWGQMLVTPVVPIWFGRDFAGAALWVVVAACLTFFMPNVQEFMRLAPTRPRPRLRFSLALHWALLLGLAATWALVSLSAGSEFLYYNF